MAIEAEEAWDIAVAECNGCAARRSFARAHLRSRAPAPPAQPSRRFSAHADSASRARLIALADRRYAMFLFAKSQLTMFQNASMNLGRAFR